jgi:glycosyltransferase involved in cell wall biosynthesis
VIEAAELMDDAVEAARLSGNVEALGWSLLSRGFVAVVAGDLDLALNVSRESVDVTRRLDDSLVSSYARWALASALLETLELAHDPGVAAACRARAEEYSTDRCTERYLELYRELLA